MILKCASIWSYVQDILFCTGSQSKFDTFCSPLIHVDVSPMYNLPLTQFTMRLFKLFSILRLLTLQLEELSQQDVFFLPRSFTQNTNLYGRRIQCKEQSFKRFHCFLHAKLRFCNITCITINVSPPTLEYGLYRDTDTPPSQKIFSSAKRTFFYW